MPFSESLAARTRDVLAGEGGVTERRMFGGLCFLLDGKMLVCVFHDSLIARIGQDQAKAALKKSHVREMENGGRTMKGWVVVEPVGVEGDDQLRTWVRRAIEFVVRIP